MIGAITTISGSLTKVPRALVGQTQPVTTTRPENVEVVAEQGETGSRAMQAKSQW